MTRLAWLPLLAGCIAAHGSFLTEGDGSGSGSGSATNAWVGELECSEAGLNALSDCFDDASVGSQWTTYNPGSNVVVTEDDRGLVIANTNGGANAIGGVYLDLAANSLDATDFCVTVHGGTSAYSYDNRTSFDYSNNGPICFTEDIDSGTGAPTTADIFCIWENGASPGLHTAFMVDYTVGSPTFRDTIGDTPCNPCWFRACAFLAGDADADDDHIVMAYSRNGRDWMPSQDLTVAEHGVNGIAQLLIGSFSSKATTGEVSTYVYDVAIIDDLGNADLDDTNFATGARND